MPLLLRISRCKAEEILLILVPVGTAFGKDGLPETQVLIVRLVSDVLQET